MEGVLAQVKALSETTTNNRNTILHYSLLASLTYLIVQGKPGLNSLLLFHFCVKVIMLVELSLMKDVTKEMYRTEEQFGSALFWNGPLLGILKTIVHFFLVSLPFNEYSYNQSDNQRKICYRFLYVCNISLFEQSRAGCNAVWSVFCNTVF